MRALTSESLLAGGNNHPADLKTIVDESSGGLPYVQYQIIVPCGHGITPVALYLAGAAKLNKIKIYGPGCNMPTPTQKSVTGVIQNTGQKQTFQLITATISDDSFCKQKGLTDTGTAVVVGGFATQAYEQSSYSQHSIILPTIGRPWDTIDLSTIHPASSANGRRP